MVRGKYWKITGAQHFSTDSDQEAETVPTGERQNVILSSSHAACINILITQRMQGLHKLCGSWGWWVGCEIRFLQGQAGNVKLDTFSSSAQLS